MSQGMTGQRLRPFRPQRFGRYTLLMPISTGGMGEIFLARFEGSHGFDKLCVIKKILPHLAEDPDFVERFVNEARILVKLSHGNIAQVLDMGVHESAPYIALEFVDGKDLRRVIARMRDRGMQIPLSFVLYTMTRVLDALAYAHRKRGDDDHELNLVHRDVSPQNVLISYEGEVKVIDFGLAKSTLSASKTNPSIIMGKFMYMSPEQARHQRVDRRSDLYAVGLCLYELISGKNPFDEVPPGELMAKVANPELRPLHELDALCPFPLSEAVARALRPDPAQRFQTADEFRGRLLSILLEIDPAAGPETAARFMREAFAVEHHAERKMLNAVKEHARAVAEEPEPADDTEGDAPRPTPIAMPAVSLETLDDPHPELLAPPPISSTSLVPPPPSIPPVESLSFRPTRKGGTGKVVEKKKPEAESIAVGNETTPAALALPPRPVRRDAEPTEADIPAVVLPDQPSIVLDGVEAEGIENEVTANRAPEPLSRRNRPPSKPRAKAAPSDGAKPARAKRASPSASPVVPSTALPTQEVRAVTDPELAVPKRKGPSLVVWLVLPLLAVLAVGGYIASDLYAEELKASQIKDEQLQKQQDAVEHRPGPPERKTREVKVGSQPEDDLEALVTTKDAGVAKTPVPVRKVGRAPTGTPVAQALRALKNEFNAISDEKIANRFKIKVNALVDAEDRRAADPAYLDEVRALQRDIASARAEQ